MDYFPVFLKLHDQPCLVVGGGEIAARKIDLLSRSQARITVIAPEICNTLQDMLNNGVITVKIKEFSEQDISGYQLIIAATHDADINRQVAQAAKRHNILVNVVDTPALCSFIFPAIIDRSPILAAISSSGASPVLTRLLRAHLESLIPSRFGDLAQFAEKYRTQVKHRIGDANKRRRFWEKVLQGSIAEQVFSGHGQEAEQQLTHLLDQEASAPHPAGEVYLVGAGPGDPDLLTFRALRLMQNADVVVYDRLVSPAILDLVRRDAKKIYAGKQRAQHSLSQESINALLARLAKAGNRVLRLKGGDPFIFGRGGEEIETLMQQKIHFQVVPGITAASGCASYAGIPLTHRDHAQSCTFVTGHLKDGRINLNWQQLATPKQTIVIYMGLLGLPQICAALIQHGCPQDLPVAIIQQGTTPQQQVLTGTLTTISELAEKHQINAPTLIIIGTVVELRKRLNWFQNNQPESKSFSYHSG